MNQVHCERIFLEEIVKRRIENRGVLKFLYQSNHHENARRNCKEFNYVANNFDCRGIFKAKVVADAEQNKMRQCEFIPGVEEHIIFSVDHAHNEKCNMDEGSRQIEWHVKKIKPHAEKITREGQRGDLVKFERLNFVGKRINYHEQTKQHQEIPKLRGRIAKNVIAEYFCGFGVIEINLERDAPKRRKKYVRHH